MTPQHFKIYCLSDPESRSIRYVGITKKELNVRLREHCTPYDAKKRTHKTNWIKNLRSKGMKPEIRLIQSHCTEESAMDFERSWIKNLRSFGCDLTNSSDGGRGLLNPSKETRKKISEKSKNQWINNPIIFSEETRMKMSDSKRGVTFSEAHRKALSESKMGGKNPMFGKIPPKQNSKAIVDQFGTVYESIKEASRKLNISYANISKVCMGKRRQANKFIFKYFNMEAI